MSVSAALFIIRHTHHNINKSKTFAKNQVENLEKFRFDPEFLELIQSAQ